MTNMRGRSREGGFIAGLGGDRSIATAVGVCFVLLLVGLVAGCGGGAGTTSSTEPVTQMVSIPPAGSPDKMSVHLDRTKPDQVQWSNTGDEPVQIVFLQGGLTIDVPAHGQSRVVAVSEFGGRGSFPYHVKRAGGSMAAQEAGVDTVGGPGDPDIDVGP